MGYGWDGWDGWAIVKDIEKAIVKDIEKAIVKDIEKAIAGYSQGDRKGCSWLLSRI